MSLKYEVMYFIYTLTGCAVNTYAIISGYFGITGSDSYTNFVLLWLRASWYGIFFVLIYGVFMPESVGFSELIKALMPLVSKEYWYLSAYFILIVCKPMLNYSVRSMEKRKLAVMIILLGLFISIPSMLNLDSFSVNKGFSPWWLMILYLIGGYIRKHGLLNNIRTAWLWMGFCGSILVDFGRRNVFDYFYLNIFGRNVFFENARNYAALTMLIAAVFLFLIFERSNLFFQKNGKIISKVAQLSFSVYLIHVNPLVWKNNICDRFNKIAGYNILSEVLLVLGVSALIFTVCILVDIPREYLFNKLELKSKISSVEERICSRMKIFG